MGGEQDSAVARVNSGTPTGQGFLPDRLTFRREARHGAKSADGFHAEECIREEADVPFLPLDLPREARLRSGLAVVPMNGLRG